MDLISNLDDFKKLVDTVVDDMLLSNEIVNLIYDVSTSVDIFKARLKDIISDLKRPVCANLILDLKSRAISSETFITMTPFERNAEATKSILNELNDYLTIEQNRIAINATTIHTCGRCKGTLCSTNINQTRRADEASKITVTCMNKHCNMKWTV
jgi:DNA-directed RNA polymerase subunit M/transcription elongation factor TFIIS